MEFLAKASFVFYTLVILFGGILAVGSGSLVRALMGLIVAMSGVAGMYLLMDSQLLAFMQLLIYVGAVAVLIFFATMLTRAEKGGDEEPASVRNHLFALVGAVAPIVVLGWLIMTRAPQSIPLPAEVDMKVMGEGLLGQYLVPFEIISAVLLVAMSGAVLLVWERRKGK